MDEKKIKYLALTALYNTQLQREKMTETRKWELYR